jgi:nucleotide-binding universal stress UspA family protein
VNASAQDEPGIVVAGVDEGAGQDDVARYAARQAALRGSPLHLIHVIPGPVPAGTLEIQAARRASVERQTRVAEPLADLVRTEFPGVPVTVESVSGRPAAVLLERAEDAGWLVVGHRGSGGFPRLPLGSVSWQVATHAACPVVVVRPGETDAPSENRVVAGVDVAEISSRALDLAYAEADLRGARLQMVYGSFRLGEVPVGPGIAAPDSATADTVDAAARAALTQEAARRRDRYPRVQVEVQVERIRPATLLAEVSHGAALLVVGSHGRTGLRRLILGSVSAEALHTAACPVAVMPHSTG